MGFKKVISDYLGKLSELASGDTIAPSQLGSGTIVDRSILKGDGSWGNNDNAVLFVDVNNANTPLTLDTFYEDTLLILSSADPTNELFLDAAQGVKLSCINSSGKSININTSLSIILNYGGGYILHPNASLQMIKDDANSSFILYEKVPLLKTLQLSGSTENINQNFFENGKNVFVDAVVPSGGMVINLPLISTLVSKDVTITIKYKDYVTSAADNIVINSSGTDTLDNISATSYTLNTYDAITFKPVNDQWLQISKFKFFDTTSANTYIITEIDFGTPAVSSKKFTITAAGVNPTDVIHVFTDSTQATGRVGDDWEVDMAFFTAVAGTGNFTLNVTSPYNMVGRRSIKYKVN